ncbi:unnamed protein product [Haemonchus placei]|uniref:Skin secretory protein xP2-like n=1 Tax=Haemonchus placei TaxID=6290 RepID=A0A158QRP5_HAEPC|nr:unnamed protein product [Haemonchus placei]
MEPLRYGCLSLAWNFCVAAALRQPQRRSSISPWRKDSLNYIQIQNQAQANISGLLALIGVCSAQTFAWPSSSYNPYYARFFAAASAPVPVAPAPVAAAYPAVAAAPVAAAYASPLSPPVAAGPAIAAATANGAALLTAPALAAPVYAAPALAAPAYAAPAYAAAPLPAPAVAAAPVVAAAPAVVPAYAPFQAAAYLIGSNKAATKV